MIVAANSEDFAQQLRKYRERGRLTQTELAGLATMSVRAVRNLEQGQVAVPRRDTVRLLADALQLSARERVSFELASGREAGDALFDTLTMSPTEVGQPLRGRERELDAILKRVLGEHGRITAITGFGGVGKTRLAHAVAQELAALHGMPTLWVSLRQGTGDGGPDAEGYFRPDRNQKAWYHSVDELVAFSDDGIDQLVRLIGDRAVLLVLDGNDPGQVQHAAKWKMIRNCRNLRILETARTPEGLPEEHRLALAPLPVAARSAGRDEVTASPAVALLLALITDAQSDFEPDETVLTVCAEVCRRLDGLPGALEAAASWFMIVSAEEIGRMARDEPHLLATHPGDRVDLATTVHEAIAAQPPRYRELLLRLADWSGSWTVAMVVARIGIPWAQVARAVHVFLQCGLIAKVTPGGDNLVKFTVLNVIRAYLTRAPEAVASLRPVP
ncbi:helix-turn-helix domain-containing protein [Streptomyces sp. NPDC058220]|uniref:helix-turn-helix domain-containing protein n=1 Tax=unclassified Streptomyces TaxID=2593676 RepID=UPI00365305FF